MSTKPTKPEPKPPAPRPMSQQELENTRVKQGVGNAPAPGEEKHLDPLVEGRDVVHVRTAEGQDIAVNPEAQNTTQTLENAKAIDENPATRALREQHDREALQHLVQNDALVTAAEQGRQQEYLREQGLVDEPDKD